MIPAVKTLLASHHVAVSRIQATTVARLHSRIGVRILVREPTVPLVQKETLVRTHSETFGTVHTSDPRANGRNPPTHVTFDGAGGTRNERGRAAEVC
jgi:hypothetical protein